MIEDYIVLKNESCQLAKYLELSKVNAKTYDLKNINSKDLLLQFYKYSDDIDFEASEEYILGAHDLNQYNVNQTNRLPLPKKSLNLDEICKKFSDQNLSYKEYLNFDKFLNEEIVDSNEVIKDNTGGNFYFSKPFLMLLHKSLLQKKSNFLLDVQLAIIQIDMKLAVSVILKTQNNDLYDISYNPPNGSNVGFRSLKDKGSSYKNEFHLIID